MLSELGDPGGGGGGGSGANNPPQAFDDRYAVLQNTYFTNQTSFSVLDNDFDPDGDPLQAILQSQPDPASGTLEFFDPFGYFGFTPAEGFRGTTTFQYTATDGMAQSNLATVYLDVHRAPFANDDVFVVPPDQTTFIPTLGVLANDRDPDQPVEGQGLRAVAKNDWGTGGGYMELYEDGSLSYTPYPGFTGIDTFTYEVTDGDFQDSALIRFYVTDSTEQPFTQVSQQDQDHGNRDLLDGQPTYTLSIDCSCDCACNLPEDRPNATMTHTEVSHDQKPLANQDFAIQPGAGLDTVTVVMTVQDWHGRQIYRSPTYQYDATGFTGQSFRVAIQAIFPEHQPSGHYRYRLELSGWSGGRPSPPQLFDDFFDVVSYEKFWDEETGKYHWGSPVGANGFSLPGLLQARDLVRDFGLDPATNWEGRLLYDGVGNVWWWEKDVNGYRRPDGAPYFKEWQGNTLIDKYDTHYVFTPVEMGFLLLTSITDRNGRTTTLTYNQDRQLTSIQGPFGRVIEFLYIPKIDSQGKTVSVLDAIRDWTGRIWDVDVEPDTQRLLWMADPLGNLTTFQYAYGVDDRLLYVDEPGPRDVGFVQHAAPQLGYSMTIYDNGAAYSTWSVYAYRGVGLAQDYPIPLPESRSLYSSLVDPAGNTIQFRTDRFGNFLETLDDLGRLTQWQRDDDGLTQQLTRPDPDGPGPTSPPVESFTWDSLANLLTWTLPDGKQHQWTYDPTYSQVTSYTDPLLRTTTWQLDGSGNPLVRTDPDGAQTQYSWLPLGLLGSISGPDPDGSGPEPSPTTSFAYDTLGRRTQITHADGSTEQFGYDPADNLTSYTSPLGTTFTWTYDILDRPTTLVRDAGGLGYQTSYTYQYADRQPITRTDPLGRTTTLTYDVLGNVTSITTPLTTEQFQYDGLGQLLSWTDPRGNTTTYTYDPGYRLVQVDPPAVPGKQPWQLAYDALDRLTQITDPSGAITSFAYNERDFLVQVTDALGGVTQLTRDAVGNILTRTDPLGRTTTYQYDLMDRLVGMTQPDPDGSGPAGAPQWSWQYDLRGRLVSQTDPLGAVTSWQYDLMDRLVGMIQPDPDGPGAQGSPQWQWSYNALGEMTQQTDPLGRITTWQYDSLGRLTDLLLPDPDGTGPDPRPQWHFTYNAVDALIQQIDPLGGVTDYQHDELDRVVTLIQPDPGDGNRPTWQFTYDPNGNRLSQTDPLGGVSQWTYDAWNRVTSYALPDPDGPGPQQPPTWSYAYLCPCQLGSASFGKFFSDSSRPGWFAGQLTTRSWPRSAHQLTVAAHLAALNDVPLSVSTGQRQFREVFFGFQPAWLVRRPANNSKLAS